MGTLHGIIRDSVSGAPIEAKVRMLTSNGHFVHPSNSILKVGRSVFLQFGRVYRQRPAGFDRHYR